MELQDAGQPSRSDCPTHKQGFDPLPPPDRDILRRLAGEVAEIAALPEQKETAARWRALNDLRPGRPMVRVYQLPWRELDVDGELLVQCEDPWARRVEGVFRQMLYQWRHMRWDMVFESEFTVPYVIHNTGYGIKASAERIPHDQNGGVSAQHFNRQITDEADIEKISMPELSLDLEATEANVARARAAFGDLLEVKARGRLSHNYAPWDRLAEWCGPQQVLMDLVMRPGFIHALMERIIAADMSELDQLEELGALSIGSGNYGVGQGGLGFSGDLPGPDNPPDPVRLDHQWGGAMAQIFSEVSPAMHEEFALAYEKRLLDRFRLNYYGCCEPLDRKMDVIVRNLPRLRKVSMSTWVNPDRAAEAIAGRFVYSAKPNPAFLATDGHWDRESARAEIERVLKATGGRSLELILKDVSTVRFQPARVWEWTEMVMDMVRDSA